MESTRCLNQRLTITSDNQVYSTSQNIEFIEKYGCYLLNTGQFKTIIDIDTHTPPGSATSTTYKIVCGTAYAQQSNLYKAIELLKATENDSATSSEMLSMVKYTLLNAKYTLGVINSDEFNREMSHIFSDQTVGSFLSLRRVYRELSQGSYDSKKRLSKYYNDVKDILSKDPNNPNARIVAYGQTVEVESSILLHDLRGHFLLCCCLALKPDETALYADWTSRAKLHSGRIGNVFKYAIQYNSYNGMSNLALQLAEWEYQKIYISHIFSNWNAVKLSVIGELSESGQKDIANLIAAVAKTADVLASRGQIEDQAHNLLLLMELNHLIGDQQKLANTASILAGLLKKHDLTNLKRQFERISAGMTDYSNFLISLTERAKRAISIMKNEGLDKDLSIPLSTNQANEFMSEIIWTIDNAMVFEFPSMQDPK